MRNMPLAALLLVLSATAAPAFAQSNAPVAGRDYVEIPNGKPLDAAEGMVVVEEFFNYICPACNGFEPIFVAWTAKLPPYVKLVHVPATFRADFVQYARAYYTAESFGLVEKTHAAVYDAIHNQRTLPSEGQKPDEARIAAFYAKYGVDEQQFLSAMKSFGTEVKVRRATEHMQRSRVPSTPSIVINGRYLVRGQTYQEMLSIASYLIDRERAATTASGN